jgi:hypothetical protein
MDEPTAHARLSDFFERLERLPAAEARFLAVRPLDARAHEAARAAAEDAIERSDRSDLVGRAREGIVAWVRRSSSDLVLPTIYMGTGMGAQPGRPDDLVRLADTLSDASLAVIAEDLVDGATYDELVGPCTELVGEPI